MLTGDAGFPPFEASSEDRAVHAAVALELIAKLPGASREEICRATDRVVDRSGTRIAMAMVARLTAGGLRQMREWLDGGDPESARRLVDERVPDADAVFQRAIDLEIASELAWLRGPSALRHRGGPGIGFNGDAKSRRGGTTMTSWKWEMECLCGHKGHGNGTKPKRCPNCGTRW